MEKSICSKFQKQFNRYFEWKRLQVSSFLKLLCWELTLHPIYVCIMNSIVELLQVIMGFSICFINFSRSSNFSSIFNAIIYLHRETFGVICRWSNCNPHSKLKICISNLVPVKSFAPRDSI